jgi:hypothetical protein
VINLVRAPGGPAATYVLRMRVACITATNQQLSSEGPRCGLPEPLRMHSGGTGDGVEPPKRTGLATLIRNATRRLEDLGRRKVGGGSGG